MCNLKSSLVISENCLWRTSALIANRFGGSGERCVRMACANFHVILMRDAKVLARAVFSSLVADSGMKCKV